MCSSKMSTHTFLIVQTIEGGRSILTTVPHKWVSIVENKSYDVLRWPNKNVRAEIEDASSEPHGSWCKMKCKIKRKGFLRKADADLECEAMMNQTETSEWDEENLLCRTKPNITKGAKKEMSSTQPNFNKNFEQVCITM